MRKLTHPTVQVKKPDDKSRYVFMSDSIRVIDQPEQSDTAVLFDLTVSESKKQVHVEFDLTLDDVESDQ